MSHQQNHNLSQAGPQRLLRYLVLIPVLLAVLTQQKYNDAAVKQFFRAAVEADKPIVVLFNLGALGSLALVVAWLLVYQVGVIWLRRSSGLFSEKPSYLGRLSAMSNQEMRSE